MSGVRTALMSGGPKVVMGQKQPSITSKWTSLTPLDSRIAISLPRLSRSAVSMPTLMVGAARRIV